MSVMRDSWLDNFGIFAIPVGMVLYVSIWWAGIKLLAWLFGFF